MKKTIANDDITDILKAYPELKGAKPYADDEPRPDEIKSWAEFDRALATFIVDCINSDNKGNEKNG